MGTQEIIIRKYGNRRLYDTSNSRYVNLAEIAAMVRRGDQLRVLDAKTGEDLTRSILMQIISEDSKGGPSGLPLEFLRQLIVTSDHVGREFLMWYLKSAFDAYGKVQNSFTSRLSDLQAAAASPVTTLANLFTHPPAPRQEDSEVEGLRKRLATLEAQLNTKTRKRRSKKKPVQKKKRKS